MSNLNETTALIRVSDAIYIFHDGKQEGPFTRRQVEAMWAAAFLSEIVPLAWRGDMPGWAPLNTMSSPIPRPGIDPDPTPR